MSDDGLIRNIRVFISSPTDLVEERKIVSEVCRQISQDLGTLKGFRVEPLMWESHSHSGIARRSQEVITEQIGKYDIYLGVMGFYFGSATGKYASGTEEEYRDALRCYEDKDKLKIQFYFSSAKISPKDLDIDQYSSVQRFKKEIGGTGVYYREFEDLAKLEVLVRQALTADILEVFVTPQNKDEPDEASNVRYSDLRPYEHLRNLNELFRQNPEVAAHLLIRDSTNRLDCLTNGLNVATEKLLTFTKRMAVATKEANIVSSTGKNTKYLQKKIDSVFESMESFNDWFSENVPQMEADFVASMSLFQRAASILNELSSVNDDNAILALGPLTELRSSYMTLIKEAQSFVENLPQIESLGHQWEINRVILIAIVNDFVEFMGRAVSTMDELSAIVSPEK